MKKEVLRLFCIAFLVASLCCVMVWPGHSMTLFRAECEIFSKGWRSMMHPLVAFPLIGQLFLLYMLWRPKRRVILIAAVLLGLLPARLNGYRVAVGQCPDDNVRFSVSRDTRNFRYKVYRYRAKQSAMWSLTMPVACMCA